MGNKKTRSPMALFPDGDKEAWLLTDTVHCVSLSIL